VRLEVQFTNPDAIAALIAARMLARERIAEEPWRDDMRELAELLDRAYAGLDLAALGDARRSVQLPGNH
jgi:hypothetical protein